MGWEANVFPILQAGNTVLINGQGEFIYNGVAANGNLLFSFTPAAGTDAQGNAFDPGFESFSAGDGQEVLQINNGAINWLYNVGNQAISLTFQTVNGHLVMFGNVGTTFELNIPVLFDKDVTFNGSITATGGTASDPTKIVTDTWHPIVLGNGWANQAGNVAAQYRATPFNEVEIIGTLNGAAATAAKFAQLPSTPFNYRPASQQGSPAAVSMAAVDNAYVQCDTSGNLTMNAANLATTFLFHAFIALDA